MCSLTKQTIFIICFLILQPLTIESIAEKVSIKGLDIIYNESEQQMIASGNAELKHPRFSVQADIITYNQKTNKITGKHNVEMIQNNQIILSDSFELDTKSNQLNIENLSLELTTEKRNQQVYINAIEFSEVNEKKTGKKGIITTCDHVPPHYFLEAENFTIYPEKRIIGQNVTLVNPLFFIPFGFWTPAYIFELGKRKIIYLMPVVGDNAIEGSFIKNQFDYVINDQWTGQGFIDYIETKGIGLGSRLNFDNYRNYESSIYYYGVLDDESNVKEWSQTYKFSDQKSLSTHIESKDMYLVQGGHSKTDQHSISFNNKTDHTSEAINYSFNQSNSSSIKPQTYKLDYTNQSDDNRSVSIQLNQSKTTQLKENYSISNQQKIGYDIQSKNTINFSQNELSSTDSRKDSYLRTKNSLSKSFEFGTINTEIDYYFDTDDDTVTRDIKNHIVQKTPELTLNMKPYNINPNWTLNETITYGYYSEYYYISSLDTQRTFFDSRVLMDQKLNGNYQFSFLNSKLSSTTAYTQYYYSAGDQNYTLSNTIDYQTDTFSFLQTNTTHTQSWVPEDGNTPFYFDERDQLERNEIQESIKLYYLSPYKYYIKYASGYNWIIDEQLDNRMELFLRPNQTLQAKFNTTYMHQLDKYSPLVSQLTISPSHQLRTTVQANYDLNDGEMINLNHLLSGSIGKSWQNRWTFNAYFTYSERYEQDYELQTLELVKDFHCRKLTMIYNRLLEEYRFQFTINAFPENNIGFTSNEYEDFRLEGVFDDDSVQR